MFKDISLSEEVMRRADGWLFDDHEGNRVFRVSTTIPGPSRVWNARLQRTPSTAGNDDVEYLQAYARCHRERTRFAGDAGAENGTDGMNVRANLAPGQSIVVQESYDPAWHAWSGGKALPLHKDAMGFMVIDAPLGSQDITLKFVTPLENQVGRVLTAISGLATLALIGMGVRENRRGGQHA